MGPKPALRGGLGITQISRLQHPVSRVHSNPRLAGLHPGTGPDKNAEKKANPNNPKQMEVALTQIKAINTHIKEVEQMRYTRTKSTVKANRRLLAETIYKYWCRWGKDDKPRDTIKEMRIDDSTPAKYTTNSIEMATVMANHYNSVQDHDLDIPLSLRNNHMDKALESLTSLQTHETMDLAHKLEYNEIHTALMQSPNNKAPSLNGIPTELYKKLNKRWKASNNEDEGIDITMMLTIVANNIEERGVTAPQLLKGWICPIYKKKDKREIVNYRPVMVLNAEYKIITTALMNKLALVAPKTINKCQAAEGERYKLYL